jgi:hypothetical protein
MKKIKSVHFRYLTAAEHHRYMTIFRQRIDGSTVVKTIVVKDYGTFVTLLNEEGALIDMMRKSDFTALIADADQRVDSCIIGMRDIIEGAVRHPSSAIAQAAISLRNRFQAFGPITRKSYNEETDLVILLMTDLNSESYAPKVALLGLTAWLAELTAAETTFQGLMQARGDEYVTRPVGTLGEIRTALEKVYHPMTTLIEANALVAEDPAPIETFIDRLNIDVDYANEHSRYRLAKDLSESDHTIIETLPAQKHTGKAITPIPVVYYRTGEDSTVELVFAEDFTLTYKNNIKVGMAELFVHGKGAYRGIKTTTFEIINAE